MDLVSLGFLFIIVLASGGIALLADEVGRKLGKSRRTLGKLRPRHTAKVFTFIVGVMVSTVTIGVLFTVSADVRAWIVEGRAAIFKLRSVQQTLDKAQVAQISLVRANNSLQIQNLSLAADNKRKVEESKLRTQAIDSLQAKAGILRDQIAQFRDRVDSLKASLTQTRNELSSKQTLVAQTEYKRNSVQGSFNALNKDYHDLSDQSIKLDKANQAFEKSTIELQQTTDRLKSDKTLLEQSVAEARDNLKSIGDRLDRVVADLASKQYDLNQAETQLDQMNRLLSASLGSSRYQPLIFGVGDEVARFSVPADLTIDQAQNGVSSLLRSARGLALEKGAKERGDRPVAGIFERIDPVSKLAISPDKVVQKIVETISRRALPQVLVATSSINAFKDEPVSLDISAYANPLVYHPGDVLAEARIDGHRSEENILDDVTQLIVGKVKDRARKDRILPKLGSDPTFGIVAPADLLRIVVKIRASDRIVRVQAYVDSETHAAGPLQLKFRLR